MVSIRDEVREWKRLMKGEGKDKYAALQKEYSSHGPSPMYQVYLEGSSVFNWSERYETPKEAVDDRIAALKERGD